MVNPLDAWNVIHVPHIQVNAMFLRYFTPLKKCKTRKNGGGLFTVL